MRTCIYAIFAFSVLIIIITGAFMSQDTGKPSARENQILEAEQFREQRKKNPGKMIDVRKPEEYEEGHLAEADQLIDLRSDSFDSEISKLDKNETYYLYCQTGAQSGKPTDKL